MISIFIFLIIIDVVLYLVNTVIPMIPWMKTVINCLAILFVCLWLLDAFGIYHFRYRLR